MKNVTGKLVPDPFLIFKESYAKRILGGLHVNLDKF